MPNATSVVIMRDTSVFVEESTRTARVDVLRLGDSSTSCWFEYKAEAPSSGHKASKGDFQGGRGKINLGPGETLVSINVQIENDDSWEPLERFCVTLTNAGPEGVALGAWVESMVYIVDDDEWPASFDSPPSDWTLITAFLRERWHHRHPKPIKSAACIFYDSVHGAVQTYTPLIITKWMARDDVDIWVLMILAAVYVGSAALNWFCESCKHDTNP